VATGHTSPSLQPQHEGCHNAACLVGTLHRKGIPRGAILDAFRYIPRDCFVPDVEKPHAWEDRPLPIGEGQTISQPYTVAYMLSLASVSPGDRVLEVGTGSGYVAALLVYIVGSQDLVTTVEINRELYEYGGKRLEAIGMKSIHRIHGNARELSYPDAPFDAVIISAQAREIPESLVEVIGPGGRLVMPVEMGPYAIMTRLLRTPAGIETTRHDAFQFVPLV
jgi:protein-L-isoaspartate(D-aspartate) O-methyltransferase